MAFHLVCVAGGACGLRLVCLGLPLTGRNRFVAASYGVQPQGHVQVAHALVTYGHDDTARVAPAMPPTDLTVPQDDTCTGGLGLSTMAPERNVLRVAQLAQAREHTTWQACLAPA